MSHSNQQTPTRPIPHTYTHRLRPRPPETATRQDLAHTRDGWSRRIAKVQRCLNAISGLHLSPMGRGTAASAYALSSLLYHMEFQDPPQALGDMTRAVAATVRGRDIGPVDPRLLCGRPAEGGFGVLPLRAHVRARHMVHASTLLSYLLPAPQAHTQPPAPPQWVVLAAEALRSAVPTLHPAQTLMAATLSSAADIQRGVLEVANVVQRRALPSGPLLRMAVAVHAGGQLISACHGEAQVRTLLTTPTTNLQSMTTVLRELHWPSAASGDPVYPAESVSVQAATDLYTADIRTTRARAHRSFVQLALDQATLTGVNASLASLRSIFSRAWRLPCDNSLKQTLWVLAINGLPGGRVAPWVCPCSPTSHLSPRLHTFWDCPVALAVRDQISNALAWTSPPSYSQLRPSQTQRQPNIHAPVSPPLDRSSLWLLQPPRPEIDSDLWALVCLSALHAMELGRRELWRQHLQHDTWPVQGPAREVAVAMVGRFAVASFWFALSDFAEANPEPPWGSASQPFFHLVGERLVLRPLSDR